MSIFLDSSPHKVRALLPMLGCLRLSLLPPLVSDDGVVRRVDHRGVVDCGEISVHQVKVVHAEQSGPDGFDLDVGKVFPNAAMTACRRKTGWIWFHWTQFDWCLVWLWDVLCLLYFTANKKALLHTGSKGHIGELLPCGRIIVEVAIRFELHPVHPGVVEPVVNSRGDAHLVAHRDGVSCCSLRKQKREQVQKSAEVVCAYTWHHKIQCWGMTHTWGERAILIIVMMGGRSRRVSFKQRSSKLRSFS